MSEPTLPDNQRGWNEEDTPTLTVYLEDETGTPIPLANIVTLKLTCWWVKPDGTRKAVNGRNLQDVLNTNNVTVNSTSGLVTWYLQAGDTNFQNPDARAEEERHFFRFDLTFNGTAGNVMGKSYEDYTDLKRKDVITA